VLFGSDSEPPSMYGPNYFPTSEDLDSRESASIAACEAKKREMLERNGKK
jgi:hypothetical protein